MKPVVDMILFPLFPAELLIIHLPTALELQLSVCGVASFGQIVAKKKNELKATDKATADSWQRGSLFLLVFGHNPPLPPFLADRCAHFICID